MEDLIKDVEKRELKIRILNEELRIARILLHCAKCNLERCNIYK